LKSFTAMDLGGIAIKAALEKAGIGGDQVDYVIMGHVIQAGAGQITARQAAVKGGIPMSVPALTVNKVCLSGLNAIAMADQLIGYGEFEVVVAGGMESMTQGPYLLPKARAGYAAAKAGLFGLTMSLAQEAARKGITVNDVAPGYIATDMVAAVPKEAMDKVIAKIPVGRLGEPDEIARTVEFLADPDAGFITGQIFSVNGGQYM
jgi:NAD(P)-dependent dehydrogenase (short-subunit alcohol dehydrogenase family)